NSFFVVTNIIKTENQLKQMCPEYPFTKAICHSDESCKNGTADIHSNGIRTGRCVDYNVTFKTCEVNAWCPVEPMENPPAPAVLSSSEDFTVLIKNNVIFPKFNYTISNTPPNLNTSCVYNKTASPRCPIFRLGDIVKEANQSFPEMAVKGGIIVIQIKWDCNFDKSQELSLCFPEYGFLRLDDKKTMPGFYIRSARYYKLPNGKEQRTLLKFYGIRFDVLVFGTVNIILFTCGGRRKLAISLVVSAIEICICCVGCFRWGKGSFYKIYNRKKYETVLNPTKVMYVSYVDEPHVTLIKKPLKTSLQHAQGSIVQRCPVRFCNAGSCCTSESNKNHNNEESEPMRTTESNENNDNEEYKPGQPLRQETSSSNCQKWCCCGNCQSTQKYYEQLCCRRKEGQCITTSHLFQELVLSHDTLKKALLYKDPFLNPAAKQLRHCAYKQYIHWRFGSFDLEDRAVIPNCCRWKIRNTYPKKGNNYTGFKID
ncbi:P2RX7 protein, partial [Pedionomus torquatus]|nr:P2RX7 protein [Pedionomus torquatus]